MIQNGEYETGQNQEEKLKMIIQLYSEAGNKGHAGALTQMGKIIERLD